MHPHIRAGDWPTEVWVQCRSERPFKAVMRLDIFKLKLFITCPNCGRGYTLNEEGEWYADRPLKIFGEELPKGVKYV